MFRGIVFDLDQTLIDSSIANIYRKNRKWNEVYPLIPNFKKYSNIIKSCNRLYDIGIKVAIVTSSPGSYSKKVTEHWKIKYNYLISYHDTRLHKPNPEPIKKAIEKMGLRTASIICVGDDINDIIAANKAKCVSVAVLWGVDNYNTDSYKNADFLFDNVKEFNYFLAKEIRESNSYE